MPVKRVRFIWLKGTIEIGKPRPNLPTLIKLPLPPLDVKFRILSILSRIVGYSRDNTF